MERIIAILIVSENFAFESWSGTALKKANMKQRRVDGKVRRFYDISLIPVVKNIWYVLKREKGKFEGITNDEIQNKIVM